MALLVLLALFAGCRGRSLPQGLDLRASLAAAESNQPGNALVRAGLRFDPKRSPPALRGVAFEGESRQAAMLSPATWSWRGTVPPGASLHAGVQVSPEVWPQIERLDARVEAESDGEREVLDVVGMRTRSPQRWLELDADLGRFAGKTVELTFKVSLPGLPERYAGSAIVAWAPVRISASPEPEGPAAARPNVLFILVDTLRHDHLTSYGYRRDTSPNLERLLAARGVVAEEAYSQAPWTLPSVVSFLTSRYPGEVLGSDAAAYGIPDELPVLAQEMGRLGYETGGFFANKILHAGNGFARGFDTFYSPPAEVPDDQAPDAAAMVARMSPWLQAHRNGPFFLYAHFIDPHDPYNNPEIVSGDSPYFPTYKGEISGFHLQGLHTGKIELKDPANDIAQVNALYDSEIHYADRFLGQLIESLPPAVLRNTLIVLTADHGEEIYDHGGWKHGFTLYEEQIHVPLLVRWDGHLPAGKRLPGVVRLIDLAPTLLSAAGGKSPASWEGVDLLPALTGKAPLPRLTAFAQHMMIGPLRAAAIHERSKLILFNPQTPFTPADDLQKHFWSLDLERLHRVELYDLASDPGERRNLADGVPDQVARLQPAIHQQLDKQIPGLLVIVQGLPAGAKVRGSFEVALDSATLSTPITWQSYFLGAGDRVEVSGRQVRFELSGEALDKGFVLQGGVARLSGLARLEVSVEGQPLPPGRVLLGAGAPYAGGTVGRGALVVDGWPSRGAAGGAIRIWVPHLQRGPIAGAGSSAETEKRLRALGYIQ